MEFLRSCGWNVLSPDDHISDMENYKAFVQSSFAEFSITKETYIKSNSGWFSGRSAVYLASGKPVITQDTRWSSYIPSGNGVIAITDLESAVEAVKEITANYEHHSNAAKEIAAEYFDSYKVLGDILQHV
jgi:phosphoribosylamine-glycine ligase